MQDGCVVAYTGTQVSPTELASRVLWSASLSETCTDSSTCKHNSIFPEGKQGGWNSCHASHLSSSILKGSLTRQICNPLLYDFAAPKSVICAGVMELWRLSRHEGRSGRWGWGGLLESSCPHRLERARRE
eukprot:1109869-Pelagomonas_calceolata.AAC.1